jgi:hypothetical protein
VPGTGVLLTGMTDVDLERETMVGFFVAVVDDFLLFDGAVERPSDETLSFVFAEPLGLVRFLVCACCFVLWRSDGRAKAKQRLIHLLLLRWTLL